MRIEKQATVDKKGRLIVPKWALNGFHLSPGTRIQVEQSLDGIHLRPTVPSLSKIYIEPTNACNLKCRTCIRNAWDEPTGFMTDQVFERILLGMEKQPKSLSVIFGGFGEPLAHPKILDMVGRLKDTKTHVEIITNGTLLSEDRSHNLIDVGLDVLWVSIDGAQQESYGDVRLGGDLKMVLENIEGFARLRAPRQNSQPEIGVVFVAMKRNIADLPALLRISKRIGVTRFMVTNIWPHTDELREEILYARALSSKNYLGSANSSTLEVPRMDIQEWGREELYKEIRGQWNINPVGSSNNGKFFTCPFIEENAVAIGWDGGVSPCLPLLHSSQGYLNRLLRFNKRWILGNIAEDDLVQLWSSPEYVAFRQRVREFDYAPCAICDGCPQSENNEEDCYGNSFPTCGGCLWACGIIQCP